MGPPKNPINGVRPSPLSINRGFSQVVRKKSILNEHKQANPVIIYAHSPKVIHTKPRDFMALVQRLTGFSRLEENEKNNRNLDKVTIDLNEINPGREDEDEVCSPSSSRGEVKNSSNLFSSFPNQLLADMPLFTPSSNNLFFSPRNLYGYRDSASPAPNTASPTWSSIVAPKKEVQQY